MTTNQTIDGVPRAALEILLSGRGGLAQAAAAHELRALLDAPALQCSVPAIDTSILGSKPAAQSQGEPVAMSRDQFESWVLGREHPTYGWLDKHWLTRGDNPDTYATEYVQGLWVASQALCAEQPAPVAVVMPERDSVRDIVAQAIGGDTYEDRKSVV